MKLNINCHLLRIAHPWVNWKMRDTCYIWLTRQILQTPDVINFSGMKKNIFPTYYTYLVIKKILLQEKFKTSGACFKKVTLFKQWNDNGGGNPNTFFFDKPKKKANKSEISLKSTQFKYPHPTPASFCKKNNYS